MPRLWLVWHATDIIHLGTNSFITFISMMLGFDLRVNSVKSATPTSMSAACHESTLWSFLRTKHIFFSKWRHRTHYMAQSDAAEVFHARCCDSKKQKRKCLAVCVAMYELKRSLPLFFKWFHPYRSLPSPGWTEWSEHRPNNIKIFLGPKRWPFLGTFLDRFLSA